MKRLILFVVALIGIANIQLSTFNVQLGEAFAQQQFRIWQGEESSRFSISSYQFMTFSEDGTKLTIGSNQANAKTSTFDVADIDSIVMIHQVQVVYENESATVTIPETLAEDVTAEVKGGHVVITNTNTNNEIECELKGSSTNGSFTYIGSYKASIRLSGVSLTSGEGAALDIKCGKRIALILEDGTENTFSDYASGTQKACLYCKGHLEVEGGGTLNVTGNLAHAIKTKEYLQLKKSVGTINIIKAAGDAIHAGQYYLQSGGTVNITSTTQGDCIQAEIMTLEDDVTPVEDKEDNGRLTIKGGTLNIEVAHEDCKAIKSDSLMSILGGTINITASGNGTRGIQSGGDIIIGVSDAGMTNPIITILATGTKCANEEHDDDPHKCTGIKGDKDMRVYSGVVKVNATGKSGRSIKVDGDFNKYGGAVSYYPAIKAANI